MWGRVFLFLLFLHCVCECSYESNESKVGTGSWVVQKNRLFIVSPNSLAVSGCGSKKAPKRYKNFWCLDWYPGTVPNHNKHITINNKILIIEYAVTYFHIITIIIVSNAQLSLTKSPFESNANHHQTRQ